MSIVEGGIYFKEFSNLPPLNISMFALGVLILIAGVFAINKHSAYVKKSTDNNSDEKYFLLDTKSEKLEAIN